MNICTAAIRKVERLAQGQYPFLAGVLQVRNRGHSVRAHSQRFLHPFHIGRTTHDSVLRKCRNLDVYLPAIALFNLQYGFQCHQLRVPNVDH
ncbi:hypothetical protein D3C73_1527730 [compost metagenome]